MKNKDTVLIIYPPGGYGTFFEWCLSYFSGELESNDSPLDKDAGSARNFDGNRLDFPKHLQQGTEFLTTAEYLNSDLNYKFVRSHGEHDLAPVQQYINQYGSYFKKIIHLRHDNLVMLEILSNMIHKIKKVDIAATWYKRANVTDSDAIWEIREKLTFLIEGRYSHYDTHLNFIAPNVLDIPVGSLGNNFEQVIEDVFVKLNLKFDPIRKQQLSTRLAEWRDSQPYLHIDRKCTEIVNATVNDRYYDWSHIQLDIFAEAYIQMQLRLLHKLQLKCYNLNVFPTNTKDLKELLFDV